MNDFKPRDHVLMIFAMGMDAPPLDEDDYLDPCDPEVEYDPEAYLEEEIIEDHLESRLIALRILRFAKLRGFTKNRALVDAYMRKPDGDINHEAIALTDELLAVVSPDDIAAYLGSQQAANGAAALRGASHD